MAYIGKTPVIGNFQKCDSITVVNGQAAYTLQVGGTNVSPQSENHMLVSLNGILQAPVDSFTISGSTLTFASNLVTGDVIDFVMILGNVLDLGVPSDNTVSLAKLTATGTKDATTFLRGDNTFAEAGGGKVLQVQSTYINSVFSTSSTSFVDVTGFNVSITPSATSSKVLIWLSTVIGNSASSTNRFALLRNSTSIGEQADSNGFWEGNISGFSQVQHTALQFCYLDSPNTTSATTYKLQSLVDSGTMYVGSRPGGANECSSTITVMEIGA